VAGFNDVVTREAAASLGQFVSPMGTSLTRSDLIHGTVMADSVLPTELPEIGPTDDLAGGGHQTVSGRRFGCLPSPRDCGYGPTTRRWLGWAAEPALVHGITNVISRRSKEEVARPNASAVVAVMANVHPFGNGSEVQLPRVAMREVLDPLSPRPGHQHAVAGLWAGACPQPAPSSLVDLIPKVLNYWHPVILGAG